MAMPGRERRSRGEIRRQRGKRRFVGRQSQLTLFKQNLDHDDPESADFLFSIRGLGGVGKSTLLGRWREEAESVDVGAVTALVDESDVHGVPQTLIALARQLADATGRPFGKFDEALKVYRREQAAAATGGAAPADNKASLPSRAVTTAAVEGAKLLPGGAAVGAMANQEALARGLDWAFEATVGRRRRETEGDVAGLSRAFVTELNRIGQDWPWIVLFFDTWERTGPYLDGWLPNLLDDDFGSFPSNVIVVLAGRDELSEREWAVWRADIRDVSLEVFTREETRSLLAQRGVTAPDVVDAVQEVSGGLPLLVGLLAQTDPATAAEVGRGGDAVDRVVDRFLQWIADPHQRETVVACALAQHLNEDIFTAAAPPEGQGLWEWLCGQSFVTGQGDVKQYHAVVRASMIRHLRTGSSQRWRETHLRLADGHAARRTGVEGELADERAARRTDGDRTLVESVLWGDERWRRHHAAEGYHRLCASPRTFLRDALERTVYAARMDTAVLRQWIDTLALAARDSADADLQSWTDRLQQAITDDDPALACWSTLLTYGRLTTIGRARTLAYRGLRHAATGHDQQAMSDLNQALALAPNDCRIVSLRSDVHRLAKRYDDAVTDCTAALDLNPSYEVALVDRGFVHLLAGRYDSAVSDLTAALALDPTLDGALGVRGIAHRSEGRYDQAVADLTAALDLDPTYDWALAERGVAHRRVGRYDQAVADLTAALDLDPTYDWALAERGAAHRSAGRYDQAVADLTAALDLNPTYTWALAQRGEAHQQAGHYDQAVADLTVALDLNPSYVWALAQRGEAHRQAGRYDQAVADLTASLDLNPTYDWALAQRGEAHRQEGRYDQAITDLTAALDLDATYAWAFALRGEAHRQAGRYDQAVTDYTAALDLDSTYVWPLAQRGAAHRQAGRYGPARDDLERACASDPDDLGYRFEKLLLDTLTSGLDACREQWAELLIPPVETPQEEAARFFALFQVLLLEPGTDVTEATRTYLATSPDHDVIADLLLYLTELSCPNGGLADRARRCRQLVSEHAAEVGGQGQEDVGGLD